MGAGQVARCGGISLSAATIEADTVERVDADHASQTFDSLSWWTVAIMELVLVGGIGFVTYSQPGNIVLGIGLLIVGGVGLVGVIGSRRLEISDVGVTSRRFFRWSHIYLRSELRGAAADWSLMAFSMPMLSLKSGRQVRLWFVSRSTLWRFRTSEYTAKIVEAINLSLAYGTDPAN
jgi:hypothetical protein